MGGAEDETGGLKNPGSKIQVRNTHPRARWDMMLPSAVNPEMPGNIDRTSQTKG
jgi:hypothetical protein